MVCIVTEVMLVWCITDKEEDAKIEKLRDKMIKNIELCQGRITILSE